MNSQPYDALIIGGGPAGSTAGLLLARAGWNVAILEQASFPRRKVCGEFVSATTMPLLEELGVADAFHAKAGPEVREIGLFAGKAMLVASMPPLSRDEPFGRALGRDQLDTLLLEQAQRVGAIIQQPWKAIGLKQKNPGFVCTARNPSTGETAEFGARIVIAAHGSWEPGKLPTQATHQPIKETDLLGFKAHFHAAKLHAGLMPLLVFPGGYGGMVETDDGRVSLSCCIRRDRLAYIRKNGISAGDAVLRHIRQSCRGVDLALEEATLEAGWLSAGPIRPGMRQSPATGIFLIGNTAGEAHPIIADGISIAMQSAWLLCRSLAGRKIRLGHQELQDQELQTAAVEYQAAWRRQFATRIVASSAFAQLAVRPLAAALLLPAFRCAPSLLSLGARLAGKTMKIT